MSDVAPYLHFPSYLVQRDDLSVGLLDLSQLGEEVPESASCDDIVWCKDTHAVELWCWVGVRRQMTPNDLVFLQATCTEQNQRRLMEVCCPQSPSRPLS